MLANRSIIKGFTCSSCRKIMHPPIKVCILGHNFCATCDSIGDECPSCEYVKGSARNLLLENLYNSINFPCNNKRRGCTFEDKGLEVRYHQQICKYSILVCPLSVYGCGWCEERANIYHHVLTDHTDDLVELDPLMNTMVTTTTLEPNGLVRKVVRAYSELFVFTWRMSDDCNIMAWKLCYLGVNTEKFAYYVRLVDSEEENPVQDVNNNDAHIICCETTILRTVEI